MSAAVPDPQVLLEMGKDPALWKSWEVTAVTSQRKLVLAWDIDECQAAEMGPHCWSFLWDPPLGSARAASSLCFSGAAVSHQVRGCW